MNRENINESEELLTKSTIQIYDSDFTGAISTLDRALELNPISILAHQYRAICKTHLSSQDNVSIENKRKYLQEIIYDLEQAKHAATNFSEHLDSSPT